MEQITRDPDILGGKPIIRGTRLSVEFILELYASGANHEDILKKYPQLTMNALASALKYSAQFIHEEMLIPMAVSTNT
jgi:uncharacterized protein (DUF433 family)